MDIYKTSEERNEEIKIAARTDEVRGLSNYVLLLRQILQEYMCVGAGGSAGVAGRGVRKSSD